MLCTCLASWRDDAPYAGIVELSPDTHSVVKAWTYAFARCRDSQPMPSERTCMTWLKSSFLKDLAADQQVATLVRNEFA